MHKATKVDRYDFTADVLAWRLPGAVTCVRCKMPYRPRPRVGQVAEVALSTDCPFCQIFGEGKGPIDLMPIRPLR